MTPTQGQTLKPGRRNATPNATASSDAPPTWPEWDAATIPAASDPAIQRGDNPLYELLTAGKLETVRGPGLQAAKEGAGSGNFQLSIPVVDLPGRGLDVRLALEYNSLFWHRFKKGYPNKDEMVFAPRLDRDVVEGFQLNFAKTGRPFGSSTISPP